MNTENRRGLGPIKSSHDLQATLDEVSAILADNPTEADREYVRALQDAIDVYQDYCEKGANKPHPIHMLRYQMRVVKNTTAAQVSQDTGINLDELLNAERAFSPSDIATLSQYFGITADQFAL